MVPTRLDSFSSIAKSNSAIRPALGYEEGKFKESADVGRSLSADKRHQAKNDAKPGEGDKGDHKSK